MKFLWIYPQGYTVKLYNWFLSVRLYTSIDFYLGWFILLLMLEVCFFKIQCPLIVSKSNLQNGIFREVWLFVPVSSFNSLAALYTLLPYLVFPIYQHLLQIILSSWGMRLKAHDFTTWSINWFCICLAIWHKAFIYNEPIIVFSEDNTCYKVTNYSFTCEKIAWSFEFFLKKSLYKRAISLIQPFLKISDLICHQLCCPFMMSRLAAYELDIITLHPVSC